MSSVPRCICRPHPTHSHFVWRAHEFSQRLRTIPNSKSEMWKLVCFLESCYSAQPPTCTILIFQIERHLLQSGEHSCHLDTVDSFRTASAQAHFILAVASKHGDRDAADEPSFCIPQQAFQKATVSCDTRFFLSSRDATLSSQGDPTSRSSSLIVYSHPVECSSPASKTSWRLCRGGRLAETLPR